MKPSSNVKWETSPEEDVQPSPDVKMEPSHIVKNEPLPKKNKKVFARLSKRMGKCLCLS